MLSKYGLASSVAAGQYNIASAPLYFVRSGDVDLHTTTVTFRYAGGVGDWWSSRTGTYTSSTSATAYYFQVEPSRVLPSYGPSVRWLGFSLRCLSTVLDM